MDPTQHPEYQKIAADVEAMIAHCEDLQSRAPDGYWAKSAQQHLMNFSHAYKRAFHELPADQKTHVVVEDLY